MEFGRRKEAKMLGCWEAGKLIKDEGGRRA
jgi:hypothetical protein